MDTIDLAALAKALPNSHKALRGRIKQALDAYSARSDLRIASDHAARACGYIEGPPDWPEKELEDVVMALTTSSLVFYARATKSKSNHRSRFDLRPMFDEWEKKEHEALCRLRDDAIAHYGPGHLGDGHSIRSDHILLPRPWTQTVMVSRHLYGTSELSRRVMEQATRAALLMQRIYAEKEAGLHAALEGSADDPVVQAAADRSQVDMGEAIGDKEMAKKILAGPKASFTRLSATDNLRPKPHR